MPRSLRVDVWFDLVCPWCWMGKRQLEQAREWLALTDPDLRIRTYWHPLQLIPDVPPEGRPFQAFYEQRLGGAQAVRARKAQVLEAAARAGVQIDFDRIATFPNTAPAHRLLALGAAQLSPDAHEAMLQRLFEGYFQRGENLGDAGVLAAVAAEHGVDTSATPRAFEAPQDPGNVSPEGVSGVPFFVFNGGLALTGALSVGGLWTAMRQSIVADPLDTSELAG